MKRHYLSPLLVETKVLQMEVICGGVSGEDFTPRPGNDGSGNFDEGSD